MAALVRIGESLREYKRSASFLFSRMQVCAGLLSRRGGSGNKRGALMAKLARLVLTVGAYRLVASRFDAHGGAGVIGNWHVYAKLLTFARYCARIGKVMSGDPFDKRLAVGRSNETAVSGWLCRNGYAVIPVHQASGEEWDGARVRTSDGEIVAPDLVAVKGGRPWFVEVKSKGSPVRLHDGKWMTGIDLKYYDAYLKVASTTGVPVLMMFVFSKNDDPDAPAGLYCGNLAGLSKHELYRNPKSAQVFWDVSSLKKLADLKDILC